MIYGSISAGHRGIHSYHVRRDYAELPPLLPGTVDSASRDPVRHASRRLHSDSAAASRTSAAAAAAALDAKRASAGGLLARRAITRAPAHKALPIHTPSHNKAAAAQASQRLATKPAAKPAKKAAAAKHTAAKAAAKPARKGAAIKATATLARKQAQPKQAAPTFKTAPPSKRKQVARPKAAQKRVAKAAHSVNTKFKVTITSPPLSLHGARKPVVPAKPRTPPAKPAAARKPATRPGARPRPRPHVSPAKKRWQAPAARAKGKRVVAVKKVAKIKESLSPPPPPRRRAPPSPPPPAPLPTTVGPPVNYVIPGEPTSAVPPILPAACQRCLLDARGVLGGV